MVTEQGTRPRLPAPDGPSSSIPPAGTRARPRRVHRKLRAVLKVSVGILAVLLIVWAPVRAWAMNWGATDAEVHATLPGDAGMQHPISMSTRAVTINATASAVWPWIVQMGYKRAG